MILEIVGYIGSFLVVISMLMSSIIKLRVINTVGSVISGVYAVICGALPLALMNLCLIIINVVNLVKLLGAKMPYELVEGDAGDSLVRYFLDYYRDDI
ncbi:MAG: YgjV family protein, partial [Oscillospiraceae bacterium]|nr:YgjV family protein [Oscillospiraceae bacterium]